MKSHKHWLNRERLSLYSCIFLVLYLSFGSVLVFKSKNMVDPNGRPLGGDFVTFWAASHLALEGHAQDAYNISSLFKAQQIAAPASRSGYVWFYPPAFFLVVLPLALLPYTTAYWVFMLSTLGAYLLVLHRIIQGNTAIWCIAGFSGLWVNLLCGQNAFLTAALGGASLLSLKQKPLLAGFFIGLLAAVKPQLAFIFPAALIACGAWRSLLSSALTAITFTVLGILTLGFDVLVGFLSNLGIARQHLEHGLQNGTPAWTKMPTLFAFGRLVGIPVPWAYILHFVVALGALTVVWYVWRRCLDWKLRGAALMTATFLVSPYALDYDLVWLAFPVAWLVEHGLRNGWLRGEREILVVVWLLPLLLIPIPEIPLIPIGPMAIFSLLWITFRRATLSLKDATSTSTHPEQFNTLP
ncbi:MAG: DUF2029 domain-containing protein [Chlorobiaceae bacterium]|nr:DUF2029 domain-containing protein [Chlorobiaceae bacterium]